MSDSDIGEHRPCKYRGWLVFSYLPADLQMAEDRTQATDYDRCRGSFGGGGDDGNGGSPFRRSSQQWDRTKITRPATDTERILLQHIGVYPASP